MIITSHTHQGRVRAQNEDALLVAPEINLFAVADGVGGRPAGEVASALAVKSLREAYLSLRAQGLAEGPALGNAVRAANAEVFRQGMRPKHAGMCTTLTCCVVSQNWLYVAHVGDSRCYLLRVTDGTQRLYQLTTDQASPGGVLYCAVGAEETTDVMEHVYTTAPGDKILLCSDGLTKMLGQHDITARLAQPNASDLLLDETLARGAHDNVTCVIVQV